MRPHFVWLCSAALVSLAVSSVASAQTAIPAQAANKYAGEPLVLEHPMSKADVMVTAQVIQGQQLRTFPLGPANGKQGVAEYRLLLSHGKVERMEPTGTKTIDGAEAMVRGADLTKLFPQDSEAKLVRGAMVNCFGGKCQLVLEP